MNNKIDIVDIKTKVKKEELEFYLDNGLIYCKDKKTDEVVSVGEYLALKIKNDGIYIIENGKCSQFGHYKVSGGDKNGK